MAEQDKVMTYAGTGVDYDAMDPFKRQAQAAASLTSDNFPVGYAGFMRALEWTRGESVFVTEFNDFYIGHVEEGLGTKNIVADKMYELTGQIFDDYTAQCTMAMIVNDAATLALRILSTAMHLAAGHKKFFENTDRTQALVDGWRDASNLARCIWGGGETPTLRDVVYPDGAVMAGSAVGILSPKSLLLNPAFIQPGDVIILLSSSGIHANGLTMAREVADLLPDGYLYELGNGMSYGEALLQPTHIYVPVMIDAQEAGAELHYAVNITGHGYRKLMRALQPFAYVLDWIPEAQFEFKVIQAYGNVSDEEMYGNFNMGAGYAIYCPAKDANKVIEAALKNKITAQVAGYVEQSNERKVIILPKGLEYHGSTLAVR